MSNQYTKPLERAVQSRLIQNLRLDGWFVAKLTLTNPTGIPDLLAIKDSTVVFIEVKRPGEKPRPLQLERHKEMTAHGARVIIYDGTQDIFNLL